MGLRQNYPAVGGLPPAQTAYSELQDSIFCHRRHQIKSAAVCTSALVTL